MVHRPPLCAFVPLCLCVTPHKDTKTQRHKGSPALASPPTRGTLMEMSPLGRAQAVLLLLSAIASPAPASSGGRTSLVFPDDDPVFHGRPNIRVFTDRDGLPQNAVHALAFDNEGFLWAGTKDGAVRYDGRTWTTVNLPSELHSNWIEALAADPSGGMWFGTSGGVGRLSHGVWTVYDESSGLPGHEVTCLLETHTVSGRSVLWVGTSRGLCRFEDGVWYRETPIVDDPNASISSIYEVSSDGRRTLWVTTHIRGIARREDGVWRVFDTRDQSLPTTGATCMIETTAVDGGRALLAGTFGGGLLRFDGSAWHTFSADRAGSESGIIHAMRETRAYDGSPVLWLATAAGVDLLDHGTWRHVGASSGLPKTGVWSFASVESPAGTVSVWAGTAGFGIIHWQIGGWTSFDGATGLPGESVYSLLTRTGDDGGRELWVGTVSNGLARLSGGVWRTYPGPTGVADATVWSLLEAPDIDGQTALWAGTNVAGFYRYKNGEWTNFGTKQGVPGVSVNAMLATKAADGSPALWIATIDGLARLERGGIRTDFPGLRLPDKRIRSLLETRGADGAPALWLGTENGLVCYAHETSTIYDLKNGLPGGSIACLRERRSEAGVRTLWIGTRTGIAMLDLDAPSAPWSYLSRTTTPALPNDTVYRIEEDARHRVYVSTNKGVARLTPRSPTAENPASFDVFSFTITDGLPSNECNTGASTVDAEGRIWVGTIAGVAVFDPSRQIEDALPKPLAIERSRLPDLGRDLVAGDSLAHDSNHVLFEFALLSFVRESDTRYRTQLVGFDDEPSEWSTSSVRDYISLPPGTYRFKVWGRDAYGTVSGPVEVPFTVRSAPWFAWWAILLYVALGLCLVYAAFVLRVRALHRRTELLEAGIAERTTQLARMVEDLRTSEHRALEANRAKSVFLANMSHELRTPLNAILGFVQLMGRDRSLARTHQESLGIISRSGEHLLSLINDVLSIAKIEAGKDTLVEQTFDLHELLRSVCEMMRVRAEGKGLAMRLAFAPDLPVVVTGDEGKLRQVLVNLLGNAVKFTDEGTVALRASWRAGAEIDDDGSVSGRAILEVADTGCGMAPDDVASLFHPFTQTESGRRAAEGTGLGLVISRDFARLMGGDLRVESSAGVGSTFTLEIGLVVASQIDRRGSMRREAVGLAPDSPEWRILVVDDTLENRVLLTRLLEALGFAVRDAVNGLEAIEEWRSWNPHLIWMDMRMPVMDGLEATIRIREIESAAADADTRRRCRIIALTASAFEHDRERFLEAGCDDFVPKPFQTPTILNKMSQHLGVRYVYEIPSRVPPDLEPLTPDELARLPEDVISLLRNALLAGDAEAALHTVEGLKAIDGSVADHVTAYVRGYRFDELLTWLDAAAAT